MNHASPLPGSAASTLAYHARRLVQGRRSLALLDQALLSATNMCTSVLIGRTCPKAQLGLYASGLSLILLVTAIQSALFAVPFTISQPGLSRAERPLFKGSTLLQQLTLAIAAMLVFLGLGLSRSRPAGTPLAPVFLALAAVSGVVCFRDFARRVSYAELHFGFALLIDAVLAAVQLITIALLAWRHQLTASRALFSVGFAAAVAGLMWLVVNRHSVAFSAKHAVRCFQINWVLGRWLLASSVLWSICIDQYPWLITALRQPSETALWASAYGVMAFLNPIVLALNNDAAPRVANDYVSHGVENLARSVGRSALVAGLLTLPVLLALLLFGARLVRLMYGDKFNGAGPIVSLLALGLWFYAISLSFPYGLLALKRASLDFAINVACLASFLALAGFLIRRHGVLGAACSFLMVQTVALILRVCAFRFALTSAQPTLATITRTGTPA